MTNNFTLETVNKFICTHCDFKCCKQSDMNRHLLTLKHKNRTQSTSWIQKEYVCECKKVYKHQSSLWNHKKNCNKLIQEEDNSNLEKDSLLLSILKQNEDLKNLILEQNKLINEIVQK